MSEIKLYNTDCLPAMREMGDNEFELAICDPPYRDQNQFTKDMRNNCRFVKEREKERDLGKKPKKEYFDELYRVSKNQIIWGANNFQLPPFKGFVVYKKLTISEAFTMSMCEIASISEDLGTVSKWIELQPQNKNRIHPTQKPIALYRWLLENYAKPGDKILDTHLGSGSIACACHDMGFDLVGYELDKDYYEAACKRLREHQSQLKMF